MYFLQNGIYLNLAKHSKHEYLLRKKIYKKRKAENCMVCTFYPHISNNYFLHASTKKQS